MNIYEACVTSFTPIYGTCRWSEAINSQLSTPKKWGFAEQKWYTLFTRPFVRRPKDKKKISSLAMPD